MQEKANNSILQGQSSAIIPVSGAIGAPGSVLPVGDIPWTNVSRGRADSVAPITVYISCTNTNVNDPFGLPVFRKGYIRFTWSCQGKDGGGDGGSVILDMAQNLVIGVVCSEFEVYALYQSSYANAANNVRVTVGAGEGQMPHEPPVLSDIITVAAGAISARIRVPDGASGLVVSSVPALPSPPNSQIRWYQDSVLASNLMTHDLVEGQIIRVVSGSQFVDISNTSILLRQYVLKWIINL